jgi:selenocysteine lyase/cysteine desulfurase
MPDIIDPDFIAEMWPTLSEMTYLNNASTGIPPIVTIKAMSEYLHNRTRAIGDFKETLSNVKKIRQNLARLLGGDYSQYGFVPSTSSGINSFAHAIEYKPGSNIVLCDLEFPSNYIPWQNVKRLYGPELRVVKSENGAAPVDAFAEHIDENTAVVAVSQIQFGSGYRIDLEKLARVTHEHGALLSVDIIQAAGCFDTDLSKLNVDFATGQAAKWMLGPIGAGYVYVSNSVIDNLTPRFLGWWGVEKIMDFGYSERVPLPDARKFQIGSPTMVAYLGLLESLLVLLKIPGEKRQGAALDNADYLRDRLAEIDVPFYDFGEKNNSATVSCAPDNIEERHKRMIKDRVHCSVRNGRFRISPHFYNNRSEIDRIVEYLR